MMRFLLASLSAGFIRTLHTLAFTKNTSLWFESMAQTMLRGYDVFFKRLIGIYNVHAIVIQISQVKLQTTKPQSYRYMILTSVLNVRPLKTHCFELRMRSILMSEKRIWVDLNMHFRLLELDK